MDPFLFGTSPKLLQMTVEPFKLGKEADVEAVLIQDPDGIVGIYSGYEFIPRISDGPQMSWSDVAGHPGHSKILGQDEHLKRQNPESRIQNPE
jgi:hypothetical protein